MKNEKKTGLNLEQKKIYNYPLIARTISSSVFSIFRRVMAAKKKNTLFIPFKIMC